MRLRRRLVHDAGAARDRRRIAAAGGVDQQLAHAEQHLKADCADRAR